MQTNFKTGYTLLEVIVASLLLSIVIFLAFALFLSINQIYSQTITSETLSMDASRILNYLIKDLEGVPRDQIIPYSPLDSNKLKFRKVTGIDSSGEKLFGNYIEWAFDHQIAGEQDNDKDDNNNGLVDEGHLVRRIYDENQVLMHTTVIGKYIMERNMQNQLEGYNGISFTCASDSRKLSIFLAIERFLSKEKKSLKTDLNTIVALDK